MYTKFPKEVELLANELRCEYYPTLNEFDVHIGIILVKVEDGLIDKGVNVCGTLKVMDTLDRLTKGYDIELLLDEEVWQGAPLEEQKAILDYFLFQIELVPNSNKAIDNGEEPYKIDELGRPRLRLKKADWQSGGGYNEMVKRYKKISVEYKNLQECIKKAEEQL